MRTLLSIAFLLICFSSISETRYSDEDKTEIEKTINKFFEILNSGDTTGLARIIHPTAVLASIETKEGKTEVTGMTLQQFSNIIAKVRTKTWEEKISDVHIQTDGLLTSVWANYTFYINGKISHCGVDSFLLIKNGKQWQILHIADTRNTEKCKG